jgi:hypothetical protein
MVLVCVSVSQPLLTIPSQSPKLALQLAIPQVPAVHEGVPFITVQARLHIPQCEGDVLTLVSQPSVAFMLQSPKPELQVKPHLPALHVVVALARVGQTFPQLPQCIVLVCVLVSQPLAALPSQSA